MGEPVAVRGRLDRAADALNVPRRRASDKLCSAEGGTDMTNLPSGWNVTRLAGALGAEIRGPDISDVSADDVAAIKALLLEHMVLFFPEQAPSVDAHVAFGRHFGELEGHPNLKNAFLQKLTLFKNPCSSRIHALQEVLLFKKHAS